MKLYLSSFHLGSESRKLSKMFSSNKKVAVIMNAQDYLKENERLINLDREINDLKSINLIPEEIDLRNYFEKEDNLKLKLSKYGGIWIRGGNVFILRRALKESGLDIFIQSKMKDKAFVYSGYSAGICVLSPTLKGYEIVDDPNVIPNGYKKETIWDGLNILPYMFAPHFKSDHPESKLVDEEVEYLVKNNIPFKILQDGDVIIETNH
jgi:dipeptidase E